MSDSESEPSAESSSLTPEQRLELSNVDLLNAGIATIHDMETLLRACVGYENANHHRAYILERFARRGREIRSEGE